MNEEQKLAQFPILKYFAYQHLPEHLQEISKPFHELAHSLPFDKAVEKTNYAEIAAALRKLLEAKDCAVRSII